MKFFIQILYFLSLSILRFFVVKLIDESVIDDKMWLLKGSNQSPIFSSLTQKIPEIWLGLMPSSGQIV